MIQKCLGVLGGHPRPIGTHIKPILTEIAQNIIIITNHRSEGFALTGYDIPGCVDDGA